MPVSALRPLPLLLLLPGLGLLGGCVGTRLDERGAAVAVMYEAADVAGKTYVGDAMGSCGSWWNAFLLTYEYQYANALNAMRNQAGAQHGQYVLVKGQLFSDTAVAFYGTIYAEPLAWGGGATAAATAP